MTNEWGTYAGLARELDDARTTERSRTEGLRAGVAEMTTHADQLQTRLEAQHDGLMALGRHLRLKLPSTSPIEPEGPVDPSTSLSAVAKTIDLADREANSAAERGVRPTLLPGLPAFARAVAVYGVAALVVVIAQAVSFLKGGSNTSAILVIFFIPWLCWFTAYSVIKIGGRTRVSDARPKLFTRFGLLLCFLVGPVGLLIVLLAFPEFR